MSLSKPKASVRDLTVPAFILYRQHYQAAVVAQNPGLANPEISKIIGEHWRALPDETKDEWKALAEVGRYILWPGAMLTICRRRKLAINSSIPITDISLVAMAATAPVGQLALAITPRARAYVAAVAAV